MHQICQQECYVSMKMSHNSFETFVIYFDACDKAVE